ADCLHPAPEFSLPRFISELSLLDGLSCRTNELHPPVHQSLQGSRCIVVSSARYTVSLSKKLICGDFSHYEFNFKRGTIFVLATLTERGNFINRKRKFYRSAYMNGDHTKLKSSKFYFCSNA
ncbi:hypothetical protein L9F63_011856, partial [Diploptera punctata]